MANPGAHGDLDERFREGHRFKPRALASHSLKSGGVGPLIASQSAGRAKVLIRSVKIGNARYQSEALSSQLGDGHLALKGGDP
jgi:hypothetical protein